MKLRGCVLLAQFLSENEHPTGNAVVWLFDLKIELEEDLQDRLIYQLAGQGQLLNFTPYFIFKQLLDGFLQRQFTFGLHCAEGVDYLNDFGFFLGFSDQVVNNFFSQVILLELK